VTDVYLLKLEPESEDYKLAPPFSILYLASALEKHNFKVKLYHEIGSHKNITSILEDFTKNQRKYQSACRMGRSPSHYAPGANSKQQLRGFHGAG
jgi:hypothetical protein